MKRHLRVVEQHGASMDLVTLDATCPTCGKVQRIAIDAKAAVAWGRGVPLLEAFEGAPTGIMAALNTGHCSPECLPESRHLKGD